MCVCVRLRVGGQRGRAGMQEECLRPHHSPAGRSASPSEAPSPRGAARPVALMASSADGANQISRPAHSEKKMAQYFPFFEKTKNRLVASGGNIPRSRERRRLPAVLFSSGVARHAREGSQNFPATDFPLLSLDRKSRPPTPVGFRIHEKLTCAANFRAEG